LIRYGLDKPLNYLNPSRISIGALLVLFYIVLLADKSTKANIAQLSWYISLAGIVVLLILTSSLRTATLANIGLGALLIVFAYRFPDFQNIFASGQVLFLAIFLLIVAVYVNRTEQVEL
jgi:uncharacterized membrane protein